MLAEEEIRGAIEEEIGEAIEEINALKAGVDYEDGVDGFEFHDKVDAILKRRGLANVKY